MSWEYETLDLEVVNSSPTVGLEISLKKKERKKKNTGLRESQKLTRFIKTRSMSPDS